jgi:hypothetical protein
MWRSHSELGQVGLCLGASSGCTGSNQFAAFLELQKWVEVAFFPPPPEAKLWKKEETRSDRRQWGKSGVQQER